MKTFLTCLLALAGFVAKAQTANYGKILVPVSAATENATVQLLKAQDSALVKVAVTDKDGNAEFEHIPFGSYRVKVSMVNFTTYISKIFELSASSLTLDQITLSKSDKQMQEVVVSAKKPFIQKFSDRIVVNVDNSVVNAGSSAFDVLERSPGVQIDPNDNITLGGKQGVTIMIDGKVTPMSGTDLVNMLRGLTSSSIESIHIITNPSAKYDAAGNSGIIDIKMKKDQRFGTNGNFTAGYGQGVYPKANAGTTFNFRNKKLNVFGNYNYAYRELLNHLILDRNFYEDGVFTGEDKKDNYAKMPLTAQTMRFGMDFFPSKKTIIGFVFNGNFNHFRRTNDNNSVVIDEFKQPSYTFQT